MGAGTDTAGGRQELGWRAAIVGPGSGGRGGGKADVEEPGGEAQTETEDWSAAFGAVTGFNC